MLSSSTQLMVPPPPHNSMDEATLMHSMRSQLHHHHHIIHNDLPPTAIPLPDQVHNQWRLLQTIKRHNEILRALVQQVDISTNMFSYPIQDPQPTDMQTTKDFLAWYFSDDNATMSC
ncbi:hypothetical protein H257_11301 [Aphanomyces astaci]|uniref:Uncharacterized protein n=1 Tax=Aphanomyces astaci TaxID=112090 RepID=W4G4L7_APHAT|nr:hypothetical protein H257_11301 [Aphanomyces astaci]ETV73989.1 hypothetical protein H257_11301 [Aphanomyces astaci]|eukprot:XP_009836502.1 hypothetical protein H257_11301 [Aphanomyces astaci]